MLLLPRSQHRAGGGGFSKVLLKFRKVVQNHRQQQPACGTPSLVTQLHTCQQRGKF